MTNELPPGARRLARRRFLELSATTLAGLTLAPVLNACAGGQPAAAPATSPAAQPAGQQSPAAFKGGGSLQVLLNAHFIPAYDKWIDQWAKEWGQKNNVDVRVDHILGAELAQKIPAEIAAGSGHDIIRLTRGGEPHLFADHLVDVNELADAIGKEHGGWLPAAEKVGQVEGVWMAVPEYFVRFPSLYRQDLFDEIGMQPDTWENIIKAGALLKEKGHPIGIAINQKSNDANLSWMSVFWSHGASFVAEDGKTVTIKSPEAKETLAVIVDMYNKAMTDEVLSWDDAGNNRFMASGRGSWIHNPISALRSIEKDNPELGKKLAVAATPAGPKAQLAGAAANSFGIMRWSQNQAAAKAFIADYYRSYLEAFKASTGYNHPMLKAFLKKPMPLIGEDPRFEVLQDAAEWTRFTGYPGPATAAAGEVENNWIIPLMVGQAVQSGNIDDALDWGAQQIETIYARYKA